jgi:hypothetical protein
MWIRLYYTCLIGGLLLFGLGGIVWLTDNQQDAALQLMVESGLEHELTEVQAGGEQTVKVVLRNPSRTTVRVLNITCC